MSIKVSVIIPTSGTNNFIYDTISSIENQLLDNIFFELIIIINNNNIFFFNDVTQYLAESSILNHKIIQTHVLGVSNARNIGIENSIGDFICFIDDDDMISDNYLLSLHNNIYDNSVVISNVKCFSDDINHLTDDYLSIAYIKRKIDFNFDGIKTRKFLSSSCCKMISKKVISEIRFNTKLEISEDALFMFQITKNIKSMKCAENDAIYYRRIRNDSASRKKSSLFKCLCDFTNFLIFILLAYSREPFKYNFYILLAHIAANFKTTVNKIFGKCH
jgi:glycosyltransferase involved in cell wall biosynthesis